MIPNISGRGAKKKREDRRLGETSTRKRISLQKIQIFGKYSTVLLGHK